MLTVNLYHNIPFFTIFMAMISAIIMPFIKKGKVAANYNMIIYFLIFVMSLILTVYLYQNNESFTFMMGHYPAPWGNELRAGALEALMATVFSLVMFTTLLGCKQRILKDVVDQKQYLYFLILNSLMGAMLALIYTNDVFTAYVFIEINALASCALIMFKENGEAIVATIHYLIVGSIASGLFLIGLSLLYDITGHLLMPQIKEQMAILFATGEYNIPFIVVISLCILGISIKSALYPFHSMLPGAYNAATPASSAILSGLVLKSYIILAIKFIYEVFGFNVVTSLRITDVIFVFGVLGMIMGSLHAMKEQKIKRMLAYSSVAQIGYIFMGMGLGSHIGMIASCFHILAHAITKASLFSSASCLIDASDGLDDNYSLNGAARRAPLAGICYTVGALSMVGVPFFAGFVSKLYFAEAAVINPGRTWIVLIALALSMVLNALYFLPSVISIWKGSKDDRNFKLPLNVKVSMVIFTMLIIGLGTFYEPVTEIIVRGIELISK